jgi:hypothetical protein
MKSRQRCNELRVCERNVWAAGQSQDHDYAIQERQHSVLTNQCLGNGTNVELPGQETEESLLRLPDSDKLIVERHWGHMPPFAQLRLWLHYN